MSNPNYPNGVTERDISRLSGDNGNIYCKCGGDLNSSVEGLEFVFRCRSCGEKWQGQEEI